MPASNRTLTIRPVVTVLITEQEVFIPVHGELFSAPLHWGFVILSWSGLFTGGIAAQMITRFSNLIGVVWNKRSRAILNRI